MKIFDFVWGDNTIFTFILCNPN